jgi:histone-lysine N-methyltransferase SETMAR
MTAVIHRLGFTVLDHPPHDPELAPSEFHLFPKLKEHLKGHYFLSEDEVKTAVQMWFRPTSVSMIYLFLLRKKK